jgi:DNA-binding transcriptional regulator YhcF (GntR family)
VKNYLKILSIDEYSITPKYLQLSNSILLGIEKGLIVKDDMLPSINDLSYALEVSRNTIERVYKELKGMGIVGSIPGKGYYIANTIFKKPVKILLLFNKLSSHKKIIYDAFVDTLGDYGAVDFYIYNNDFHLFKKIITEKIQNDYSKFILISHFLDNQDLAHEIINTIPKDKLILMDKLVPKVNGDFAAVYEDFEADIYGALKQLIDRLSKYHTINIIFPENTYHSKEILKGFLNFCSDYAFDHEIISSLSSQSIKSGNVYISLMEDDLVELIKKAIAADLKVGTDIGVISYNETAIKQVILNGITTISTDFKLMGIKAAELVINNRHECFAVPFKVTLRDSL